MLGHIPAPTKDSAIAEMFRVLKPGGVTLHLIEIESAGWMACAARREPDAYREVWIDYADHHGLESADSIVAKFRRAGFEIEFARPFMPGIPSFGTIASHFSRHQFLPLWLRAWRWLDGQVARNETLCELLNVLITPLALFGSSRPSAGIGLILKARKP